MTETERASTDLPDGAQREQGAEMRARRWAIAATREPAAYAVPKLPAWGRVDEGDGVAVAGKCKREPFISADEPASVRR